MKRNLSLNPAPANHNRHPLAGATPGPAAPALALFAARRFFTIA